MQRLSYSPNPTPYFSKDLDYSWISGTYPMEAGSWGSY